MSPRDQGICLPPLHGRPFLSCYDVPQTGMIEASHVSVHNWVHRLGTLTSRVPKRERECIAVDESKLKANGSMLFVWSAIDIKTKGSSLPCMHRISDPH